MTDAKCFLNVLIFREVSSVSYQMDILMLSNCYPVTNLVIG